MRAGRGDAYVTAGRLTGLIRYKFEFGHRLPLYYLFSLIKCERA